MKLKIITGIIGLASLIIGVSISSLMTSSISSLMTSRNLPEVKTDDNAVGIDFRGNNISLSPSKIWISNITAGSRIEQYSYIKNNSKEDIELTTFANVKWVSFDSNKIEVAANNTAKVHIVIDIPPDLNTKDKPFEFLAGVKKESSNINIITCAKYFVNIK